MQNNSRLQHLRCYLILEDRQIAEQNEMSCKMASQFRKENADLRLKIKELKDETMCLKTVADSMYDKVDYIPASYVSRWQKIVNMCLPTYL